MRVRENNELTSNWSIAMTGKTGSTQIAYKIAYHSNINAWITSICSGNEHLYLGIV